MTYERIDFEIYILVRGLFGTVHRRMLDRVHLSVMLAVRLLILNITFTESIFIDMPHKHLSFEGGNLAFSG